VTPAEANLERTIVEGLVASGWIEGDPSRVDASRALLPDDLIAWLRDAHPTQWERLAMAHGDALPERIVRALDEALREGNTPDVLRAGFKFDGETIELVCYQPPHGRNPDAVARAANNRLVVTRQAPIEAATRKSVDLLFSLNGVPVATVELKHRPNAQDASDARQQYSERPTHLPIFRWPTRAVVHFAVDEHEAWMTTHVRGAATTFVPFNRGTERGGGNPPNPDGYPTDYLWKDVWTRESFLTLLQRYVHHLTVTVERGGELVRERRILFPRWHQRDAVRALLADVAMRGPGQRYLVEHSAGSGKSNTIAWLAWHLADLHDHDGALFDKVVVVTDRTVLDRQLAETIEQMTKTPAQVCQVREQSGRARRDRRSARGDEKHSGGATLTRVLDDPSVRIVIVTVQTFLHTVDALNHRAKRSFAVLLDEAHSGVGEETGAAMAHTFRDEDGDDYLRNYARDRQHPNQSLFAFTATPRPETLYVYGREDAATGTRKAFHRYTMQQAIAERFILDVRPGYIRYDSYFRLGGAGVDDPEVDPRSATAAVMREVSKDPTVMQAKCRVIVRHFLAKVRGGLGGEARAMVVASSRESAVRYQRMLRKTLDPCGARSVGVMVAFSGSVKDPDTGKAIREVDVNGCSEKELPRRFASGSNRILVVANKFQTGFDQPLLSAMYIDRPLADVQAVQTVSRLNRPCGPDKKVFALDFVNGTEVLDALARFLDGTSLGDAPTAESLAELRERLDAAEVYTEAEVYEVARLALEHDDPRTAHKRQEQIAGVVSRAVDRYEGLVGARKVEFRGELGEFLRLYALMAQVVLAPDPELEARAIYGAWLYGKLPGEASHVLVNLAGRIVVEHYRLAPVAGPTSPVEDDDEDAPFPGEMTLATRSGVRSPDPALRLSELLQRINDRYGFGTSPADRASLDAIIEAVLGDDVVLDAVRAAVDARDLVRDGDVQKQIRKRFRERERGGDALAARFSEGDEDLRRELMEIVLEMAQRRAPKLSAHGDDALSPDDLARLAELGLLRNSIEPRLRGFVRRTLEQSFGAGWFDELLRSVPEHERKRVVGLDPEVVLRERLYLSTLVAVIDKQWSTCFGGELEAAPAQERLSRAQCVALLEVLNAHREDAHARPIREADLTTVRALVHQFERVLDRVQA
jgi:type I restriction enzyme R subunit